MEAPTVEVLEARKERAKQKARDLELLQKRKDDQDKALVDMLKNKYPDQLAEFNRLKTLKAEPENIDYELHWLQSEMLYGREWKWDFKANYFSEFSPEEKNIISDVASKYYEVLEKQLWTGQDVVIDGDELIRLIENAGVDTFERDGEIFFATLIGVHHSTRVHALTNAVFNDVDAPDELSY